MPIDFQPDTASKVDFQPDTPAAAPSPAPAKTDQPSGWQKMLSPVLNALGLFGGGALGLASPIPGGSVAGAGLGYAGSEELNKYIRQYMGQEKLPQNLSDLTSSMGKAAKNTVEGGAMEAGGQALGPLVKLASKPAAQILGRSTNTGTMAIKEAVKGGQPFTDAMRGNISGDEVVGTARTALNTLKEERGATYRAQLDQISQMKGAIDDSPIQTKLNDLLASYKVKVKPIMPKGWEGLENNPQVVGQLGPQVTKELDFSGSKLATDKAGQQVINTLYETVSKWEDKTASGLDTLKQAIANTYSESSAVRQFSASLEKTTKDTIVKSVPKYAEMTKGYESATSLIKDIESAAMLRKEGMSGRVVADQTLRRLTSSMKDNFELRGDLVRILGEKSGTDLMGQVAGNAMKNWLPTGVGGSGITLTIEGALAFKYLNPQYWPLLAASSPRMMGEFLNALGKGITATKGAAPIVGRTAGVTIGNMGEKNNGKD